MKKMIFLTVLIMILASCATTGPNCPISSSLQKDCDRREKGGIDYTGGLMNGPNYSIYNYCMDGIAAKLLITKESYQFLELPSQWMHGTPTAGTKFFYFDGYIIVVESEKFSDEIYNIKKERWEKSPQAGTRCSGLVNNYYPLGEDNNPCK